MVRVGSDERSFTVDSNWEKLPSGWEAPMAAVAVDSRDRVYGFNRGPNKVIIFDKEGNYLDHWEDSEFIFPHAIYADHADNIWIVDSCLLYTSPSPRDRTRSRMPSSA